MWASIAETDATIIHPVQIKSTMHLGCPGITTGAR